MTGSLATTGRAERGPVARRRPPRPPLPVPACLTSTSRELELVEVPARTVVALEGRGAPEDGALQGAIAAVHGVVSTLGLARRARGGELPIGPVEARWWTDDPGRPREDVPRSAWRWRVRLAVPDDVTPEELAATVQAAVGKKRGKLAGIREAERVAIERLPAQRMLRALHVGPYAEEGTTLDRLRAGLQTRGLRAAPGHLEIYLNDPRRTAPARLKTVLLVEVI